ncbi:MFS transporter [Enterovirga rhinocerotis]|uniref:Putative MFS family arabinose efflux permease n=1 Tax=Enterovirga rhinocerotis TaxID=1339210 RepID=A0A4R7CBD2_9HYPH|nr:MFS transporter [Enterovirga rhinocerotis]TDR94067.1 putative MFS family arabinose efflux permease [Enterovirga rhinocerotis]
MSAVFRSLAGFNYRVWAAGALVSNIGTWMQRTGQDWIVLAELTDRNATAVGIVMGLQFGPQILLLPVTGWAADRFDRRRLLFATQAAMGLLALGLGALVVTGLVALWHVFVFAFLLGCVSAFDAPARQTFVSDLVDEAHLSNAVALNSASFNLGRTIGPAIAGFVIAAAGSGWVFLANALSFVPVLVALGLLRRVGAGARVRPILTAGSLTDGLRYVSGRPDLRAILLMLFFIGMLGLNFPIFISSMSVQVFQVGSAEFGLLTSCMAVGSVAGALLAARRERPGILTLTGAAALFGLGLAVAAAMPNYALFGLVLVLVGIATQSFTTGANSLVQLSSEPAMRGRVMAIHMALLMGTTPVGGPLIGWVADTFGPRWAIAVGAAAGLAAAVIGLRYLVRDEGLRSAMLRSRPWRGRRP